MSAASAVRPRRPRRIAADEAHAWARNLRLGNPYAKLVLSMLTIYVNGDGACFVGAQSLADDCELALETVRKRLAWLESIGAVTRLPQWVDEHGRRNSEGRGKRTTDEIRLMVDLDPDLIEARARGEIDPQSDEGITPPRDGGQSDDIVRSSKTPAPQLGVCQPPNCVGGLDSLEPEPEPERLPPNPPQAGGDASSDGFEDFEEAYPEPILRQSLARQVWSALTPEERDLATTAAQGYTAWRLGQRKPPNALGAHLFLRERDAWARYAQLAPQRREAVPDPVFVAEGSAEWRARTVLALICDRAPPAARPVDGHGDGIMVALPLHLGGMVLADCSTDTAQWLIVEQGSPQCAAWRERVHEALGLWIEPTCQQTGETIEREVLGTVRYFPVKKMGLRVPCQWPPLKHPDDSPPMTSGPLMTEDDESFVREGC